MDREASDALSYAIGFALFAASSGAQQERRSRTYVDPNTANFSGERCETRGRHPRYRRRPLRIVLQTTGPNPLARHRRRGH